MKESEKKQKIIDKLESVKSRLHIHNIYDRELIDKVIREIKEFKLEVDNTDKEK
jgi:transcriptional regulator of NAD metabolism